MAGINTDKEKLNLTLEFVANILHEEKLIPLMIKNAKAGKKLPVYGNGKNIRDWIHVADHCSGIDAVLHGGTLT